MFARMSMEKHSWLGYGHWVHLFNRKSNDDNLKESD